MTTEREAREMAKQWVVRGIVQGNALLLDEPLPLPDGTPVTVTIAPKMKNKSGSEGRHFTPSWLMKGSSRCRTPRPKEIATTPLVKIPGKPLSQIILEERR
jgi:hypothetical protein